MGINNSNCLKVLLCGLNEIIHAQCLASTWNLLDSPSMDAIVIVIWAVFSHAFVRQGAWCKPPEISIWDQRLQGPPLTLLIMTNIRQSPGPPGHWRRKVPCVLPSVQPTHTGKSEVILIACDVGKPDPFCSWSGGSWVSLGHRAGGWWCAYNQLPGGTRGCRDYSHREAKF